jgi:hypothetical protein
MEKAGTAQEETVMADNFTDKNNVPGLLGSDFLRRLQFQLSSSGEGHYGRMDAGMMLPIDSNSELFARANAQPYQYQRGTPLSQSGEYGGMVGYRRRF